MFREKLGKKVFYCTNNSTKSRQDYVEKCQTLGFGGELVGHPSLHYLISAAVSNVPLFVMAG